MNESLNKLSSSLMDLHKALLDFQTAAVQLEDKKNYGPMEVLNMTFKDPRFQWLRKLSQMIIQADIRSSKKVEPGTLEAPQIYKELTDYFNDPDFIDRYEVALVSNPILSTKMNLVQKYLNEIGTLIH